MQCVFLPGMMCDERLFRHQVASLPSSIGSCVLSCREGDSLESYAHNALSLLDRSDTQKTVLVGLSMGGIIAMECMKQFPELIDGVVLLDTNHLAELPERQVLRYPQIERALDGELKSILIDEMKPVYLAPVNRDNESILALVLDMAMSLGADVFARQSTALMHRQDYTTTLRAWAKPALILCGEYDTLCPASRHEEMHALMSLSSFKQINDAGHLPTLEAADAVNDYLLEFLTHVVP